MTDAEVKKDELFDEGNEVPSNWVSWGAEGDYVAGTLIAVREMVSKMPDKVGEKVAVYEIKCDRGEFHKVDEETKKAGELMTIAADEIYNVGGKPIIDRQMRNVKLGTKVGLKYTETQPPRNKGFNPLKVIKVYVARGKDNKPLMDEAWIAEQNQSELDKEFQKQ